MAVAYSEDIAAAGAVAGLPYGDNACAVAHGFYTGIAHQPWAAFVEAMRAEQQEPEEQRLVPLMVIHSANDTVVPIRNARHLRDSWIAYYGAEATPASTQDCTAEGVPCAHDRFADPEGGPWWRRCSTPGRDSAGRTSGWAIARGRCDDTGPIGAAVQLLPAARARAVTAADWRGARQARLEGPDWHAERFQSSVSR